MSTLALGTSEAGANSGRAPLALRYADLGLLLVALPVFILADLPLLGYGVCAAAWLLQHGVLLLAERGAAAALARGDRRRALGTIGLTTLGRVWLVTLSVLLVGVLADREDGLAAAVLALILVTAHFACLGFARLLYPEQEAA